MGEDAHLDASDDDSALLPASDDTFKHEEWQDRWICSIDGSYAVDKEKMRHEREELLPWSEYSSIQQLAVLPTTSKDSIGVLSGVILDDSRPLLSNVSKKFESATRGSDFSPFIHLPQSLEIPMKQERLRSNTSRNQTNETKIRRDISPIRYVAELRESGRSTSKTNQIYDPLRRIVSQSSIPNDDRFNSELQAQGEKLMNGLKAILNEKLSKGKLSHPSSSCTLDTMTTISRVGSASTVSSGRDVLTREVRRLENVFAEINLGVEADRARAGGDSCPPVGGEHNTRNTFDMPDMVPQERPCSSSRGTSTVEQARLSSRGSVQILTENAIRDAEDSSRVLRRLRGDASCQSSTNVLREKGTNTTRGPVRHVVITHRVKHADCCLGQNRMNIDSYLPQYHQFKLRPTISCNDVFNVDSVNHLSRSRTEFECEATRPITTSSERKIGGRRTEDFCRKTGGGKRGRPIVIGRTLYGRGRVHFRPISRRNESSKRKSTVTIPSAEKNYRDLQDAATSTVEEVRAPIEANSEFIAKTEVDNGIQQYSLPQKPKHKSIAHHKVPFVGSGLKCSNTFSIAGNQQQVMKIVSIRFQEWLPLVRNIIYDSQCKDYAQALLRDLSRQKRSNLEQIRILERDFENCKVESEKHEISADITRLKQQWTRKHDRVLRSLSEHISKGGVYSKVQQLRTIYGACAS